MKIKNIVMGIFLGVMSLSTAACVVDPVTLPEEYVECTNQYTDEVFRYVAEDATIYPDAFCVVDSCIDWYVIYDLHGKKREYNDLEMENEWFCTIEVNREE